MEHEMCQYLDWELNVEPSTLKDFEEVVRMDLAGPGSYPTYVLAKLAGQDMHATIMPNSSTSPYIFFVPWTIPLSSIPHHSSQPYIKPQHPTPLPLVDLTPLPPPLLPPRQAPQASSTMGHPP